MGKSARAQNARLEQLRAEQARKEQRTKLLMAGATVVVVLLVVGGIVAVALQNNGRDQPGRQGTALDQATFSKLTTVPASVYDAVGVGTAQNPPKTIDAPALTADGKPRVVYVGAEFCPFCASQRWALVTALSRFGTWNNLSASYSAPAPEVNPDTPTVTFRGATFTSQYVSFTGYETASNKKVNGQFEPLDKLSDADDALFKKYNAPPFVDRAGAIPWMTLGGNSIQAGASYASDPLLGRTHAEIADALQDPNSRSPRACSAPPTR